MVSGSDNEECTLSDSAICESCALVTSVINTACLKVIELLIIVIQWILIIICITSLMANQCILYLTGWTLEQTMKIYSPHKRIIPDRINKNDYLERYYIFIRDRDTFPFNIFIHKFLQSDPDDMHDHPWAFAHMIIRGGYWETVAKNGDPSNPERFWRGPGYFNWANKNYIHKVELDSSKPAPITVFIPFKQTNNWGFYRKGQSSYEFVEHDRYFNERKQFRKDL